MTSNGRFNFILNMQVAKFNNSELLHQLHEQKFKNIFKTPYSHFFSAINRALNMNFDERQMRMSQLKKREKRMDVDAWVRGFMAGMSTLATDLYSGEIFSVFLKHQVLLHTHI